MEAYLHYLLVSAWERSLFAGSSSNISVFYLCGGGAILTFVLTVLYEWNKAGRTMAAFVNARKQFPTYAFPILSLAILWTALFCRNVVHVAYEDHDTLTQQRDGWKKKAETSTSTTDGQARNPRDDGPPWRWQPNLPSMQMSGGANETAALITANRTLYNLAFEVKCSVPCRFSQMQSMAFGRMTGIQAEQLPSHKDDATTRDVRVLIPGRLDAGDQVNLAFVSLDDKATLSLKWVHDLPEAR
jgi:hypothetical protein